jgi:hypothetical protein
LFLTSWVVNKSPKQRRESVEFISEIGSGLNGANSSLSHDFPPDGKNARQPNLLGTYKHLSHSNRLSGRQDAALHGRKDACLYSAGAHILRSADGLRARIAQGGDCISIHLMLFPMAQSLRRFGVYQADNIQVLPARIKN